jgi:hypothetical protein
MDFEAELLASPADKMFMDPVSKTDAEFHLFGARRRLVFWS